MITKSVEETMFWAENWAKENLISGSVVCLRGDLGAGKTHIVKSISKAFGVNPEQVNSPTFTLIHEYNSGKIPVFHFDCYRLKSIAEALEIGVEDYFYGDGICCIEWPERIEDLLPENRIEISISHLGNDKREIVVTSF
jgi:tRNA threonylcarbamoyladenosine biosynthesis protein TsaE